MKLSDIVSIQPGFKAAISIKDDLLDEEKIRGYIPTENGVIFLEEIFRCLDRSKSSRPIILTGTYGTGKSHLGLVTAAMLTWKTRDNAFNNIIQKLASKWQDRTDIIRRMKKSHGENPFLLVYLEAEEIDYGAGFLNNVLILALKKALAENELSELMPEIVYDSAVKRIQEIKDKYPKTYSELERKTSEKGYFSVDNLVTRLRSHDRKALDDFSLLHREVCAGAPFDVFSNLNAIDVYKSVVEAIKRKGYGGILLIWDEFTPVMKKLVADPESSEAMHFQRFAQMCEGSGANKIIFITISHRTIEEMIDIVSAESLRSDIARAAEKISGRFKPISLGHIDKEAYHLMSNVILHGDPFNEVKQRFNERFLDIREAIKNTNLFYNPTDTDLNTLIYNLYPLHPITTFVLAHLSDRIGQRNRSIFTYLCDTGESTFRAFLGNNTIANKLPLIFPKDVLDYFLPVMKTTHDDKDIRKMTKAFFDKKVSIDSNDLLSDTLLRTVLLLNATKAAPATQENIRYALGAFTNKEYQEISNKLQELRERKILKKRISDNGYYFYGVGTDTSIDDHLLEIIKESERNWSLKILFNKALQAINIKTYLKTIDADDYNTAKSIKRKIDLDFISPQELNNPEVLFSNTRFLDGRYCLILATNEGEVHFAEQKIKADFKTTTNMLFAIPSDPNLLNDLLRHLKRLKAFEVLPDRNPAYSGELREELITEEEDIKKFLQERFEDILDPMKGYLSFYHKGEKVNILAVNELKKLVSKMMHETFPYTPPISREELIDDDRPDTLRKYKIPLIDTILSPKAPTILINEKDSTRQHLIEVFLKQHGILRKIKGEWIIAKPDVDNEMSKGWDEIDSFIKTFLPLDLNKLTEKLRLPPYGLKKKVIGPILATVMRQYILENQLVFYWKGNPVKITGEVIEENLIKKGQEIRVLFQEITEKHKLVLKGVQTVFGLELGDMESVYRKVVNWWRELPQYSRNTSRITNEMKQFKDNFFVPLSSEEKDKKELFNAILPDLLGLVDLSKTTEDEIEDIVTKRMTDIKGSFENIIDNLENEIASAVKEYIGDEEGARNYYKNLPDTVKKSAFTGDSGKILKWCKRVNDGNNFNPIGLAEDILGRIDNWTDESVIKLKGHIESAKNSIESHQPPKDITELLSQNYTKEEILFNIGHVKKFHKYFKYYEDLENAPNRERAAILYDMLKSSIEKNFNSNQITGDEILSIICRLLIEVFKDA
ncbi:MAG: hypothetical protein AB1480_00985 [Nitrospirota bacterium]